MCHTLSSPESGRQSGLQIRFTHRRLSPSNGRSDFVAHTAGVPPSALGAWRGWRWAVGSVGKPERLARWVWVGRFCLGGYGEIGGYMETQKAVFGRSVRVFCVGYGLGRVWSLVVCMETQNALCGVWGMVLCCVSGNSLGFRGYGETLGAFGRVGTWRGRFACVETSALCFCETSGVLSWGYGNLKGSFECVKTSVCSVV